MKKHSLIGVLIVLALFIFLSCSANVMTVLNTVIIRPGDRILFTNVEGYKLEGIVLDTNGDGIADGIDLTYNGEADLLFDGELHPALHFATYAVEVLSDTYNVKLNPTGDCILQCVEHHDLEFQRFIMVFGPNLDSYGIPIEGEYRLTEIIIDGLDNDSGF